MTLLTQIPTKDWSLSIDTQGEVVQDLADIHQCIYIICTTQKGTDPLRPTFGCDIFSFLDKPVNTARAQIIKSVTEAIAIWEIRAEVKRITVAVDNAAINLKIEWVTKASISIQTTKVKYGS